MYALNIRTWYIRLVVLLFTILLFIATVISTSGISFAALSEKQKSLYNSGILYYEYDYGQCNTNSATVSSSKVYMLGDSYSVGLTDSSVNIEGAITEAGYTAIEVNAITGRSITGEGNDPGQSGIQAVEADQNAIKAAGVIIIELGTNPNNYDKNIPLLMNDINALNAGAKKYWVNVNHYQSGSTANIKEANDAIEKYSGQFGYSIIDWRSESSEKRDWFTSDGLHPNNTGYTALKDLIVSSIGEAPISTGTGSLTDTAGLSNEEITWRFLIGKGLTPNQAAGWMANIKEESGFDPKAGEGNTDGNADPRVLGVGIGLVQWTNPEKPPNPEGRRYQVVTSAKNNDELFTMAYQLNYMWDEMTTDYKGVYEKLLASTTAQEAHDIIIKEYERPREDLRNIRIDGAQAIMNEYLAKYAGVSGLSLGDDKCTNTGLKLPSGTGWDLEGPNAMAYYRQDDPKWADLPYGDCSNDPTIKSSGCGPTSMAMIVSTLTTNRVEPPEMAQLSVDNGYRICNEGTDHGLANFVESKYNLKMDVLANLDEAADILRKGGLVWAGFGKGTFTSGGHLMVIRKVSDDGQSFYLADPYSDGGKTNGESNVKAYTKAELTGEGNLTSMYGFYK